MRTIRAVLPLLVLLACTGVSEAFDLSAQSRTYLGYRETVDSDKIIPLYEYLDFRADAGHNITVYFGGWYRYDLKGESFGEKSAGDLQYVYLGYRAAKGNAFVNLGRVMVNQGVASERVDGAAAGTDLAGGFDVSAFGGSPVETSVNARTGDSIFGGRLSHGKDGLYRIGVSYLMEKSDSEDFREESGLDLWFRPFAKAELLGTSVYNNITEDWAQHNYFLTLGPFRNVSLRTELAQVSYKDFFTSATMSAFQLQPGGMLDPLEKFTAVGEEISIAMGALLLSGDYKKYSYDIAGDADYFGGRATYTGSGSGSGISVHRMNGDANDHRYSEYRLYAYKTINKLNFTADALMVKYDTEINGISTAYAAAVSGTYAVTPRAVLGTDVEYGKNPFFDKDIRAMVKLVYNFDYRPGIQGTKGRK